MTSEAQRLHGHLIGQQGSRRSLNTPALVLDLDALPEQLGVEVAPRAKGVVEGDDRPDHHGGEEPQERRHEVQSPGSGAGSNRQAHGH